NPSVLIFKISCNSTMKSIFLLALSLVAVNAVLGGKPCHQLKSETEKAGLLGAFIPRCEPDGTFSRVQCHGSECFCSHSDGTQIPGFKAPIHESQDMDCNCARDQFEYLKTKLVGKMFRCEPNGNYNKVQCLGSACYCVDKLGKQVGGSVHISKSESMNC
ncbi:hypothetical protein Ahia01_000849200, partial [Argonauta hians]